MGGTGGVSNHHHKGVHGHKHAETTKSVDKKPAATTATDTRAAAPKDEFHQTKASKALAAGEYGKSDGSVVKSAHGAVSEAEWNDPARLVSKLTQYPHGAKDAQSQAACSASNLLAASLMSGGPEAAASMLEKVAKNGGQLSTSEQSELTDIAGKIRSHSATFEDLNRAQVLTYRSANTVATVPTLVAEAMEDKNAKHLTKHERTELQAIRDDPSKEARLDELLTKALKRPVQTSDGYETISSDQAKKHDTSGLTDDELKNLGSTAVGGQQQALGLGQGPNGGDLESFHDVASSLKPGEAMTLRVAGKAGGSDADHYVTVGRRKDGTYYLYNPDPSKHDSTLVLGGKTLDKSFEKQLGRYDERMVEDLGASDLPPAMKYSP